MPEQPPVRGTASFNPCGSCRVGATPSNWCGQEVHRGLAPQPETELNWRGGSVASGFPSALAGAPTGRRPAAGSTNPGPRVQQVCLGKGWQRAPGQVGLEGWACAGEGRRSKDRSHEQRPWGRKAHVLPEALCNHLCVQVGGSRCREAGSRLRRPPSCGSGLYPAGRPTRTNMPDLPCSCSCLPAPRPLL